MPAAPLLYESHMHTPLCRHARGEPEEYAEQARRRNLRGVTVTCHNPCPDGYSASVRMREEEFPAYLALVERARAAYAGRVDVRLGLEYDYAPGFEPWIESQLGSARFSHVLGSVHPQMSEYRARYDTATPLDYQRVYFEHLARAAESRLFDTLAHPDLVKNIYPAAWDLDRIMPDVRRALDRIARTGVAMELNTSGRHKDVKEINPGPRILFEVRERGIPVVLGSDAHEPGRVAEGWEEALDLLASLGFTHLRQFIDRQPHDVPIPAARASLTPAVVAGAGGG
jgi:histidinol-phosphatase (PHP family)